MVAHFLSMECINLYSPSLSLLLYQQFLVMHIAAASHKRRRYQNSKALSSNFYFVVAFFALTIFSTVAVVAVTAVDF